MSLYAAYLKERFNWETIEVENGFITYDIKPPNVAIEDFYISPELRGSPLAKMLADQVLKIAKDKGCTKVWAKVTPGLPWSEHALKTNLHYGFKLVGVRDLDIILSKDIID